MKPRPGFLETVQQWTLLREMARGASNFQPQSEGPTAWAQARGLIRSRAAAEKAFEVLSIVHILMTKFCGVFFPELYCEGERIMCPL